MQKLESIVTDRSDINVHIVARYVYAHTQT